MTSINNEHCLRCSPRLRLRHFFFNRFRFYEASKNDFFYFFYFRICFRRERAPNLFYSQLFFIYLFLFSRRSIFLSLPSNSCTMFSSIFILFLSLLFEWPCRFLAFIRCASAPYYRRIVAVETRF